MRMTYIIDVDNEVYPYFILSLKLNTIYKIFNKSLLHYETIDFNVNKEFI